MASTFSTNLAIELIGTGDQAGTWGTTTNSNLGTLIEQAISGYVTQAVATGTDTTITIPNGSTGVARNMYIELTGTGGASTNLIVPANKKLYFIFNNSTGAVTVKVSGQTGVSVPTGKKMVLVSNGTDIVNGLNYIADFGTNSFSVTNLTASSATITNLIATSGSITNLVSSDASATVLRAGSATLTHLSATSATITNLTLTSLVISNLSIASANITTLTGSTQTLSGNLTLSGGTANGVLFLNGSKVATSGTALVFDGTNLGIGTASPGYKLDVRGVTASGNGTITTGFTYDTRGLVGTFSNHALGFITNGASPTMLLDTSGNLGIGTASPAQKLHVASAGNNYIVSSNTAGSTSALLLGSESGQNTIYSWTTVAGSTGRPLAFYTGASESMRLDSSGNLGIGTASPATKLQVNGGYISQSDGTVTTYMGSDGTGSLFGTTTNQYLRFVTNNTERARITAAGELLVGTTSYLVSSTEKASFDCGSTNGVASKTSGGALSWNYFAWNSATSGNNGFIEFGTEGTYTPRGSITYNRAGGLVAYNTTSDYRAKDILGPVQNSGATIDALKVYEGQMKGATQSRPMLIAHEAQEYAPYAVSGVKDEVKEDGTPKYQQMDVSALVPLLLAEVQSLRKRVAELESK